MMQASVKLLIKVQSVSDLITNSSSEVFLCQNNTNLTLEQLKNFIEVYHATHDYKGSWEDWQKMTPEQRRSYDHPSGMGGDFQIVFFKDLPEDHWYRQCWLEIEDKDNCLLVDTDWNHQATIDWLKENLNAISFD